MPTTITDPGAYLDDVRATHIGRAVLRDPYGPDWSATLADADDDKKRRIAQAVRQAMHRRYPTIF